MEYIKKEELKDGDVFVSQMSHNHFLNKYGTGYGLHLNLDNTIKNQVLYRIGGFAYNNMRLATSEEKHWLNCCITADKFITFEEAMKTFIPEYYQYIGENDSHTSSFIKGKTYKIINKNDLEASFNFIDEKGTPDGYEGINWKRFKPSTKEAYDAQFVVKEHEFVLPGNWGVKCNSSNYKPVKEWAGYDWWKDNFNRFITHNKTWLYVNNGSYTEITFDQFKKYVLKEETVEEVKVIKPLPQFKVIETIETITKVENNEGNQFFIGDIVISSNGTVQTIESFDYNKAKTNIIAFTNKRSILGNGIGIDKIEHYVEPKVE